jgi:hypothetical protein
MMVAQEDRAMEVHSSLSDVRLLRVLALAGALVVPTFSEAAEPSADEWTWSATAYLWGPSVGGQTAFPPDDQGPPVDVDIGKVLESINLVFMGAVEGRRGPWGVFADVVYIDMGASRERVRDVSFGPIDLPANVDATLRVDLTGWQVTFAGTRSLVHDDAISLQALAGVRMLDLDEELGWSLGGNVASLPFPQRSGSARAGETQWNAIVGLKGRARLGAGGHWYLPFYLDAGTGESDFTWQAMAGVGYGFERFGIIGVWRYVDYDLGEVRPIRAIDLNGPALGVTYRF